MNLLGTLRITSKNNFGIGALAQNLLGQTSHSTSTLSSSGAESTTDGTSDICRVRNTLRSNIVLSKGRLQSFLESWADSGAHVANLSSTASEDVSHGLADAVDDIVLGRATETAAEAREAAELGSSKRCCESTGGSEAGDEEGLHVGDEMRACWVEAKDKLSESI